MSLAVLPPALHRLSHRAPSVRPGPLTHPKVATSVRPKPSNLERAEDDLIARLLPAHPNNKTALDAALDDMAALSAEVRDSRRQPLLLRSATQLGQIEDLLLEAVVRTHPNRELALDRLMDDLAGGDAPDETDHDNDCDSLG